MQPRNSAWRLIQSSLNLQLMGKERNVPLEQRSNKTLHYYDAEICKYNLCGLCPYTLFSNTKSFLGAPAARLIAVTTRRSTICSSQVLRASRLGSVAEERLWPLPNSLTQDSMPCRGV